MPIESGTRLGPYEITAMLGEGGMGEVWQATDSRLRREVALKVLPEAFAADAERLARFEREAQVLAQLNHPHIAHIHGLEVSGERLALVMELVPGPTLEERLRSGPLPLDDCLQVARQIAEALEEAHEKGIVHRDLKPANIKRTPDGSVKVLDFGLAKALQVPGEGSGTSTALERSPTLTAGATVHGVILGTAAYMAPEQAKGEGVDRRADIWAFGVVLYEMLTGRRLFAAGSVSETLALVLTRPPDLGQLPPGTPRRVRELLRRCLARAPRHRLQAIGDARVVLEEVLAQPEEDALAGGAPGVPSAPWRSRWALAAVAGWALAAVVLGVWMWRGGGVAAGTGAGSSPPPRRTEIVGFSVVDSSRIAISPDGREVVGYDMTPSRPHLLARSLDDYEVRPISGTASAFNPFFSPDGSALGFFSEQELCVVARRGGSRRCLAPAGGFAAGSWGQDGSIVYSSERAAGGEPAGLWRVASQGGVPQRLTALDHERGDLRHAYPQVLPDGKNVLFSLVGGVQSDLAVVPLAGGAPRTVLENALAGRYVGSGHLVYQEPNRGRLMAVPFDLGRLAIAGTPVAVLSDLGSTGDNVYAFDVSDDGTLVYSVGAQFGERFTVDRVDRRGAAAPLVTEVGSWAQPRVSPDGRLLLLRRTAQPDCSLWAFDLARGSLSRLAIDGDNHGPLWLADSGRFLSSQQLEGRAGRSIIEVRVDGTGVVEHPVELDFSPVAESVSRDGRWIVLTDSQRRGRNDIYVFDGTSGETRPFLVTPYDEDHPALSPDGTLIAYAADDSGRSEVYVRPFPGPGGKYAVSTRGGTGPVWSADGGDLFYAEGERMMRVEIRREPHLAAGAPEALFESADFVWDRPRNYDVLPDGSGFVIVRASGGRNVPTVRIVFDWFGELERLAPLGRPR